MTENDKAVAAQSVSKKDDGTAPFTLINYLLFAGGLLDIIIGWFLLRAGHITVAPIMLIVGYCVIIPMAIVFRTKTGRTAK